MSPHARHTSSSAVELSAEECGERSSSGSNSSSSGCTCGGDAKTVSLSARVAWLSCVCVAVSCRSKRGNLTSRTSRRRTRIDCSIAY